MWQLFFDIETKEINKKQALDLNCKFELRIYIIIVNLDSFRIFVS